MMRPFDETLIDLQTDSGATTTLWLFRDRLSARKEAERKQRGERRGEERRGETEQEGIDRGRVGRTVKYQDGVA